MPSCNAPQLSIYFNAEYCTFAALFLNKAPLTGCFLKHINNTYYGYSIAREHRYPA